MDLIYLKTALYVCGNYRSFLCCRVYEKKKKAVERLEEQLTKLEVQATDKVGTIIAHLMRKYLIVKVKESIFRIVKDTDKKICLLKSCDNQNDPRGRLVYLYLTLMKDFHNQRF